MITDALLRAAEALRMAEELHRPIAQFGQSDPDMTAAEAYEVQRLWSDLKRARGTPQLGYKIGLTSTAAQTAMKTDEPVYGHLMGDFAYADGADVPTERFMTPRIEMELAFVLAAPLAGHDVGIAEVLEATEYVAPAFELCAYRTLTPRTLIDTIADNCASSGLVLGERRIAASAFDLAAVVGRLTINGAEAGRGASSAVMDHPAASVAWLARKLSTHGPGLQPGQIVLSGAFVGPFTVKAGDVVDGDFGELGGLALRFV